MAESSDEGEPGLSDSAGEVKERSGAKRCKLSAHKVCGVCGDQALGYNFNAISCESCKAFFRRNAFKDSKIQCLFEGNCVIDIRTRRFCPACRMKKCLEIGMKKEMILDDGERKARMAKVIKNRAMKRKSSSSDSVKTDQTDQEDLSSESLGTSLPAFCDSSVGMGTNVAHSECSSPGGAELKLFQQVPPDTFPADPAMYRQLTDDQRRMLSDMAVNYETTIAALPDSELSQADKYQTAKDLVNNSEICVLQLIKFVKGLEDFRLLSQEDQIAALKGCVLKSQLLRSVAFYIMERDTWLTQKGEIPTSILLEATGLVSLHRLHVSYCRTLKAIVLNNFTLFALMQVMLIFNPDSTKLTNRELMSNLQDKYTSLLMQYLESEFSFAHSHDYFVAILTKLLELKTLSDQHSHILLQVIPSQVQPLMLEILNLK